MDASSDTWQVTDTISGLLDQLLAVDQDAAALGEYVGFSWLQATLARFDSGKDPAGIAWPVSQRARLQGGKTLVDKGNLRDGISTAVSGDTVLIGSNTPYAAIHQFGGTIKPKTAKALYFQLPSGGFIFAQKVNIPARAYIGLGTDDENRITDALERYLARLA